MKRILLLALSLVLASPLAAQGVRGRVIEDGTGQPISGATVALVQRGERVATATTDERGAFVLPVRRGGEYRLQAQRIGYAPVESGALRVGSDDPLTVEVRMAASTVVLDPVRVVGVAVREGLRGRVLEDGADQPIADATVTLINSRGLREARVQSDASGRFRFRIRFPDRYQIRVQRVGYRTATSPPITLTPDDTADVEMRLSDDAVLLAPLTVVASSQSTVRDYHEAGFEWRREHQPWGRFMGPDDIRRVNPFNASDVLQQFPFVRVEGGFDRRVLLRARGVAIGTWCDPTVYVDGYLVPVDGELSVDTWVRGTAVYAMEVYDNPISAPGEFHSRNGCGVVVIWTRPGGARG